MVVSGPGSFENDEAMNWVSELETYADDGLIIYALNTIIDQADAYPEAADCSIAIAAAEVIAAQLGAPHEDCPDEVETWVAGRSAPTTTKVVKARQAIEVILTDSELLELWQASDGWETWRGGIDDLLSRLPY